MVDIETLGVCRGAVIWALAAVEFDLETGQTGRTFHERIDIQSCLDAGLKVDGSTVKWWMKQGEPARAEFQREDYPLISTLASFRNFIEVCGDRDNVYLWGNSASFDLGILTDAYRALNITLPWKYSRELDARTLMTLWPQPSIVRHGTHHNPLDDCLYQIQVCTTVKKCLRKK
jgi:hypothetical protein